MVMTGGGTLVHPWVQAVADATALPVECVRARGRRAGGGMAGRFAAGLETPTAMSEGRWERTGRVVEPDARWVGPVGERYERFRVLADGPTPMRAELSCAAAARSPRPRHEVDVARRETRSLASHTASQGRDLGVGDRCAGARWRGCDCAAISHSESPGSTTAVGVGADATGSGADQWRAGDGAHPGIGRQRGEARRSGRRARRYDGRRRVRDRGRAQRPDR